MLQFVLISLLCTLPPVAEAADDPPDERTEDTSLYRAAHDYVFPQADVSHGSIWVDVGYGQVNNYFDEDGSFTELGRFDLPEVGLTDIRTNAQIQTYVVHVGGAYNIFQYDSFDLSVGANLGLAQTQETADALAELGIPATDRSSGFSPQNLMLFAEGGLAPLTVRIGYLLDLGPDDDPEEAVRPNTDMQNAIMLGASGQHRLEEIRLLAGLTYVHTVDATAELGVNESAVDVTFNHGDVLSARAGAAYGLGPLELGAVLIYRLSTEGEIAGEPGSAYGPTRGAPNEFARNSVLSLIPFATLSLEGQPYRLFVKGATQREYVDYGWAITGEEDVAPRIGFTIGARYTL